MLVTFKTSAYSDITMFGSAAVSLLKMMGQSGNVPGAILAADIPQALQALKQALAEEQQSDAGEAAQEASSGDYDDEGDNRTVGLATRAGPLISLLEAAAQANENIQWDS